MNGARAAAARILTWVTVVTDNYRLMTTVFCVIRPADERLHGLGRPSRPASLPELPLFPGRLRREIQRHPVDAVAQAGRRRTIGEHMAEMAAALAAMHLG